VLGHAGQVDRAVAGLQRQATAARHGIARVHRQIEDHVLQLVGIGVRPPLAATQHGFEDDAATERMHQQIGHAGHQMVHVEGNRLQRLLA